MLTHLRIENIILVDTCLLEFGPGLNVLSGETGSGKSAIMQALALVVGKRADCSLIRRGASKGRVEAVFEEVHRKEVHSLLHQAGISHEAGSPLIIRREVSCQGKSRSFVNDQAVHLTLLRQLGPLILEIVGQHSTHALQSPDFHRKVVDSFGELKEDLQEFGQSWKKERQLLQELDELRQSKAHREADMLRLAEEVEEIESAALKPEEEEELFSEYSRLMNVEGVADKVEQLNNRLSHEEQSVIQTLHSLQPIAEQLAQWDPSLKELSSLLNSAQVELQEIVHTLGSYQSKLEHNPSRAEQLNDRLALLRSLKRKYGPGVEDVLAHLQQAKKQYALLQDSDEKTGALESLLDKVQSEANQRAHQLSSKRKQASTLLAQELTQGLQDLNMPKAQFLIEIKQELRHSTGDDHIEFFVAPNLGESPVPAKDCASGGELSRIMLALTTVLSQKEQIPSLVFDEIDANIGGETASVVGTKLRSLGERHQILCITHFPQVARLAHQHIGVCKREVEGRTLTEAHTLSDEERQGELARMMGGSPSPQQLSPLLQET